jgi:hypothetical protein
MNFIQNMGDVGLWLVFVLILSTVIWNSFWTVGPVDIGLVRKRFAWKSLENGHAIAFNGEAGYQAVLLMPGLRFKLWPIYTVTMHPMVQIQAGQVGVVIAQDGEALPSGAKSAVYKPEFADFQNFLIFIENGGQRGVQRPVLSPGTVAPIHPVGFLVVTKQQVYGVPVSEEFAKLARQHGKLTAETFGLNSKQLEVTRIEPVKTSGDGKTIDMIGIVTAYEGAPLLEGAIANRLGAFDDIGDLEASGVSDGVLLERILSSKNGLHNNYQNFQEFLAQGGRIGLQHDPLLYGAYTLNPFLVSVEMVPMLVVNQGEVAVVKAYVGLATEDTSGADFKFGSLVRPGHRGIWREAFRTGKYAINPRCYSIEFVPTAILTLNWAEAVSKAHSLDKELESIKAKSKEGFEFILDLQVQIHIPDTQAPKVISMVGTIYNLVNEVLQAAVGNHFRDQLGSMKAISFIEGRQNVQIQAEQHIKERLESYVVETRGVYIQDVILPEELVTVLKTREIATQQKETYTAEQQAQETRVQMEATKGTADMQSELSTSKVHIDVAKNKAEAVMAGADGESYRLEKIGRASAVETEAEGLAVAAGLKAQQLAVGKEQTALINIVKALTSGVQRFMPENLAVTIGGENGVGANFTSLTPLLMKFLQGKNQEDTNGAGDKEG